MAAIAQEINLQAFLNIIALGSQDEAEALLKVNPTLALAKGNVTDPGNRTFNQITAFQYATWALDWHMWKMLLNYIPQDAVCAQLAELKTGPWVATHGEHAGKTIQALIDALKDYIDNNERWSGGSNYISGSKSP